MSVPILQRDELLSFAKIMAIYKNEVNNENELQIVDNLKQQCELNKVSKRDFDKLIKQVKEKIEEQNKPVAFVKQDCLPSNIKNVGEDYIISDNGVFLINGRYEIEVCPHPVFPIEILKDIETGEEKVRIAYKRKGEWHDDILLDRYDIATTRGIVKLSTYGLLVNDQNAGYLVKFFCDIEKLNEEQFKVINAVGSLGYSKFGFVPYSADVIYNNNNNDDNRRFKLYKEHGNFDSWLNKQIEIFNHTIPKIIVAAGYASLLIEKIGINPFGVHLWGETGLGKSVALLASASIYGYPDIKNGIIYTGNATANGLETRLAFVKNCAFYLDELSILSQKQIDDMIYLIMQGQGKARMSRTGGSKDTYYWNLVSISNAEMPITNDLSKGGAYNRIIQVGATQPIFGDLNLPDIANCFKENYGFGANLFLNNINIDEIITLKKQFYNEVIAFTEDKQANSASVLLTAFEIARKYIYKTDIKLTAKEIIPYLNSTDEISQVLRGYRKLVEWIDANYKMFNGDEINQQKWGNETTTKENEKITNIFPFKFSEFCNLIGINEKQFLIGLREHKLIVTTQSFKNVVKFNEKPTRVISVKTGYKNDIESCNQVVTEVVTDSNLQQLEIAENEVLPF